MDILKSAGKFVSNNGEVNTDFSDVKVVAIYFSAHWCPPCRNFTPVLAEFYKKVNANGKVFEVVFATSDNDEKSFKEYLATMPWIAFPFGSDEKEILSDMFQVSGIPRLVVLNVDGNTIEDNGRNTVASMGEKAFAKWVGASAQKKQFDPDVLAKMNSGGEVTSS